MIALRKQDPSTAAAGARDDVNTDSLARALLDQCPVGMTVTDSSGNFVGANPAYQRLSGYSEAELQTMSFLALTHKEDANRSIEAHANLFAGRGTAEQFDQRLRRRGGDYVRVKVHLSSVPGNRSGRQYCIATVVAADHLARTNEHPDSAVRPPTGLVAPLNRSDASPECAISLVPENTPVRVLLVDDHALVRAGIRTILESIEGVEVVGEVADGMDVEPLLPDARPDLVVADVSMKRRDGIALAGRLAKNHPEIRVLVLSVHTEREYVSQALRCGVSGYVVKDGAAQELALAIRAVMRGESYLSPAVSSSAPDQPRPTADCEAALPSRQRQILKLLAQGCDTREIAARLSLAPSTVNAHRQKLMKRLNIRDVAGLVRYAIRAGLLAVVE